MPRHLSWLSAPLGLFILALTLPAARCYSDPIPYQVQPIAGLFTAFETGGGSYVPTGDLHHELLSIDGLNDRGQLLFKARGDSDAVLVLYSDGHQSPIALPSGPAPGGVWPDVEVTDGSINQQGEVAFAASIARVGEWLGLFHWDAQTQQSTQLVLPGLRPVATRSLVFGGANAGFGPPLLSDRGDIAFTAPLSDLSGYPLAVGAGLFFRDHKGRVMPVAITGDTLPGIGTIHYLLASSLNDSGVVGFLASVTGSGWSAFTWANGKITPVALVGQTLPGGEKLGAVQGVWVNSVNQNVLVDLFPVEKALPYQDGLYLVKGDQITPVAVPGQAMPGGGAYFTSATWPNPGYLTVSAPDAVGQSIFLAMIRGGGRRLSAIYRVDADGQLERLLQDGDTTPDGLVKLAVAYGPISLQGAVQNGKGQLALPLATNAASTVISTFQSLIALLTPTGLSEAGAAHSMQGGR